MSRSARLRLPLAPVIGMSCLALACLHAPGCAAPGTAETPARGAFDSDVLEEGAGGRQALPRLAGGFYQRIANRRFNSIATYQDPALREFFLTDQAWSDYYAELVQRLTESHFEANRPTRIEVREIEIEEPGPAPGLEADEVALGLRAKVTVRFTGENGLPLRWWETRIVREDRWEQREGRWWIIPGKL